VEAGVTYFDTAQLYGDGQSETNLGHVLRELKPDVVVGTKVRLNAADMDNIEAAILAAAELSIRRLQRAPLDLFQLHNPIGQARDPQQGWIGVADLEPVRRAFEQLYADGKVRAWGLNGLGETTAIHQAVAVGGAHTLQVCYNLINGSAGWTMPPDYPFQDYARLLDRAVEQEMGVMAIRVLAGGALSGDAARHPLAAPTVAPIASSATFAGDVAAAQHFRCLVDEGWATSLAEAALRFAIGGPGVSTALIGLSDLDQLEQALAAASKGPLPASALDRVAEVWAEWGW
jgi:aryl-alcohol dehydrogenase-like predicted oxidoreductase